VEIIAHRGASADAPENTLAAMKLAWAQDADAIEADLWLTKDGKIVVFHDDLTQRFDGKRRRISDLTWAEAQEIDVGSWKDAAFKSERIPSLEAVLATVPAGKRAVLEIKCGPEIVPELQRTIAASGRLAHEVTLISFDFETLKGAKAALPEFDCYFLADYEPAENATADQRVDLLLDRCKAGHFDGLDLHHCWPMTLPFVAKVHAAGMKLVVWTVDEPAVARYLNEMGIDAITTNKPGVLKLALQQADSDAGSTLDV